MKNKFVKQLVTLLVVVVLISGSIVTAFADTAATTTVQPGLTVQQMMQSPDSPITRGEFARLVNTYLGLTGTGTDSFKDVPAENPYAADIAMAKSTGYFTGDGHGNVNPDKFISGSEAVMVVNFFMTSKLGFDLSKVNTDESLNVPGWAKTAASNLLDLTMVSKDLVEKQQLTVGDADKFASSLATALMFQGSPYALSQASQKDDFYAYNNRQFLATATISAGNIAASSGGNVRDQTNAQLTSLVSGIASQKNLKPGSDEWKINEIYNMYMDNDTRTKSLEKLTPVFNDIKAAKTISDLDAVSVKYADKFSLQPFYEIGPISDAKNDARKWSAIILPNMSYGLPANYYADSAQLAPIQKALKDLYADELKFIGETNNIDQRAQALYDMQKSVVQNRTVVNLVSDMALLYTPTTWDDMGPIITRGINPDLKSALEKLPVYCPDTKYIQFVSSLYTENNLEALKDAAMISVLSSVGSLLGDNYLDLTDSMVAAIYGSAPARAQIDTRAMAAVETFLKPVLSNMYAAKYGNQKTKDDVMKIVEAIRQKRIDRVNALDWMSADTKVKAVEKLKAITVYVAYPDKPIDELNYEVTAKANGGNLIDLYMSYSKAAIEKVLADLQKPVDQNRWNSVTTYLVDANYSPMSNSICIPSGILQAPFYDPNGTFEENLGGIGAIIGHEFTHSVDNNGAKYDKNGTLTDWWTVADYAAFEAKTKTVADKLSQITFAGQQVNGNLTVSEAIADLGGLSAALSIAEDNNLDTGAVFKAWTNVWAFRAAQETAVYIMSSETHLSPKLRANFISSQQDAFYKDFNIQPGDGMYTAPEDRVNVW